MFAFQLKMLKAKNNTALNKTKKESGTDSYMTKVLELSEKEYIVTMVNILRIVIENIDNRQEWVSSISREMETQKKKAKRKC